ncbi:retropepsin-like aspartic protease [Sphingomonas azotifigens]|uniref:retropepsin-like aspartic protease n=1 Tax=Sphingomonas azotifigens TaxID=330920 RepID=UPI00111C2B53|nr:retropepsin-like aspartic protease [Sphingomonas azotifigens]
MLRHRSAKSLLIAAFSWAMISAAPAPDRPQPVALAEPNTVWVPITITKEGLASLAVDVAGKPGRMVLDTGASSTVLFEDALERLDVHPIGAVPVQGAAAHGEALVYRLRALTVAGRSKPLSPVRLARPAPLEGIDGILGADWLDRTVLAFDAPGGRIGIGERTAEAAQGDVVVPFRQRGRIILFAGKLNGQDVTLVLDSGAATSVANAKAAALAAAASAGDARSSSIAGAAGSQRAGGSIRTLGALSVGDRVFAEKPFFVADLPVFKSLRLTDTPGIILGLDRLKAQRFVVDYRNKTLTFR